MAKLFLKKRIDSRIAHGHPWVFHNEVGELEGNAGAGDVIDVFSSSGSFVGRGYYNPASKICLRFLSRHQDCIDAAFFHKQILTAWEQRQRLGYAENCRLIAAEADGLPGLIVDKYGDYLVLQIHTLGMEQWRDDLVSSLQEIFAPKGIYERSDVPVREKEGLPLKTGFLSPPFDTNITIFEHGTKFAVDIAKGPRTGFYLEHSKNRQLVGQLGKGLDVLDLFCYCGAFGIQALQNGARSVCFVDYDEQAIGLARHNAAANGWSGSSNFELKNAFEWLKQAAKDNKRYDLIVLDPPAFVSGRGSVDNAMVAYKEVNLRALKLLRPGGYLFTTANAHQISWELFRSLMLDAAKDAKRSLKQIGFGGGSPDFPVIWSLPNTDYMKYLMLQVL